MSPAEFDRDAYLSRIGGRGVVGRDLAGLTALSRAHMRHFPFENLDVLLGRPPRLDLAGLQEKLVAGGRGGYCFEQASLLAAALESLGFAPVRHSARVVRFLPREQAPRTHMFLTVELPEGVFVVDPGLGGYAPRVPVPLAEGAAARDADDIYRMERRGQHWFLRLRQGESESDLWISTLEADNPMDFEMGNHFTATHPASMFRQRLLLRALTDEGRVTVMNRDVNIWRGNRVESLQLADRRQLRELLARYFGFDLPEVERLKVPAVPEWTE
jgi:N-hydroxyarylamine O-acetyltransferase